MTDKNEPHKNDIVEITNNIRAADKMLLLAMTAYLLWAGSALLLLLGT